MNEYGVLSFLHEILYESSEEILDRAEKVGQQPNEVLAVIRVLKQTRVTLNDKYKNRENNQKRQKERTVKEMKALADKTSLEYVCQKAVEQFENINNSAKEKYY